MLLKNLMPPPFLGKSNGFVVRIFAVIQLLLLMSALITEAAVLRRNTLTVEFGNEVGGAQLVNDQILTTTTTPTTTVSIIATTAEPAISELETTEKTTTITKRSNDGLAELRPSPGMPTTITIGNNDTAQAVNVPKTTEFIISTQSNDDYESFKWESNTTTATTATTLRPTVNNKQIESAISRAFSSDLITENKNDENNREGLLLKDHDLPNESKSFNTTITVASSLPVKDNQISDPTSNDNVVGSIENPRVAGLNTNGNLTYADTKEVSTAIKPNQTKENNIENAISKVKDGIDRELLEQDFFGENVTSNDFISKTTKLPITESYLPHLENLAVIKSQLSNIIDFKKISTSLPPTTTMTINTTETYLRNLPLNSSTITEKQPVLSSGLINHQNKTKQGRAMSAYKTENENEVLTTDHPINSVSLKEIFKPTTETNNKYINLMKNSSITRNLNADKFNEIPASFGGGEKRGKFINDNSTNAQHMNLPNMAEVWSLVGMKAIPKSNATMETMEQQQHHTSEYSGNNEPTTRYNQQSSIISGNSEKTLVDWMKIMSSSMDLLPTKNIQNQNTDTTNTNDTILNATAPIITTTTTGATLKPLLLPSLLNEVITAAKNSTLDKDKAKVKLTSLVPSSTAVYQNLSLITTAMKTNVVDTVTMPSLLTSQSSTTLSWAKTQYPQNTDIHIPSTTDNTIEIETPATTAPSVWLPITITTTEPSNPTTLTADVDDSTIDGSSSSTSLEQPTLYPTITSISSENDTKLTSLTSQTSQTFQTIQPAGKDEQHSLVNVNAKSNTNAYTNFANIVPNLINNTIKANGITTPAATAVAYDTTTTSTMTTTMLVAEPQSTISTTEVIPLFSTFATSNDNVSNTGVSSIQQQSNEIAKNNYNPLLNNNKSIDETSLPPATTTLSSLSSPSSSSTSSNQQETNWEIYKNDNQNGLEEIENKQTSDQNVDTFSTNTTNSKTKTSTSTVVKTSLNKQIPTIKRNEEDKQTIIITTATTTSDNTSPIVPILTTNATAQPTSAAETTITTALPTITTATETETLLSITEIISETTTATTTGTTTATATTTLIQESHENLNKNRIANDENTVKDIVDDNDFQLKTTTTRTRTTPTTAAATIHSDPEISETTPTIPTPTPIPTSVQNILTTNGVQNNSLEINIIEGLVDKHRHHNKYGAQTETPIMHNSNEDGAHDHLQTAISNKTTIVVDQVELHTNEPVTDLITTMTTPLIYDDNTSLNTTYFNRTLWNDVIKATRPTTTITTTNDDKAVAESGNEIESKSEDMYKMIVDTVTTNTTSLPEFISTTGTVVTLGGNSVFMSTILPTTVQKTEMEKEHKFEGNLPVLTTIMDSNSLDNHSNNYFPMPSESTNETDINVIVAITVSIIGVIALILLVAFLYLMRKRQKSSSYSQRCRPVSLDDYTIDNTSIYNSMRTKGSIMRSSKRSHANLAFDDPSLRHNILDVTELAKFIQDKSSIFEEFRDVPQVRARIDEVPNGCEDKNRYANVVPLPETRVVLQRLNDDPKTEYINANYVRGPKDAPHYYIACQAPLENTIEDFWRMIWEQQSRVIIQATDLIEGGVNKCAEYLPPSVTLDNHCTFGDYQIVLQNREVKDRYAISTILVKHINENNSREITHYWYKWPETGVPNEEAPIIAMLLEVRSSLISYSIEQANELKEKLSTKTITLSTLEETTIGGGGGGGSGGSSSSPTSFSSATSPAKASESKDKVGVVNSNNTLPNGNSEVNGNLPNNNNNTTTTTTTITTYRKTAKNQGPLTVHCSPGTGRTGTIIACDIALRSLEMPKRTVDVPQIVYYVRHGRASAVLTKEQYEFIYKVANMYATKISSSNSIDN